LQNPNGSLQVNTGMLQPENHAVSFAPRMTSSTLENPQALDLQKTPQDFQGGKLPAGEVSFQQVRFLAFPEVLTS
jgi:hypothetical protein